MRCSIIAAFTAASIALGGCADSASPVERCVGNSMSGASDPRVLLILPVYLPIAFGVCALIHGQSSPGAPSTPHDSTRLSEEEICARAIEAGDWSRAEQSQPYVREAQRRGHTPATCAQPGQSGARSFPL
jgi:hypothetical protein